MDWPKNLYPLRIAQKSVAQEVDQIAQSYLTKVFKKTEGMTPKSFRKNFGRVL